MGLEGRLRKEAERVRKEDEWRLGEMKDASRREKHGKGSGREEEGRQWGSKRAEGGGEKNQNRRSGC